MLMLTMSKASKSAQISLAFALALSSAGGAWASIGGKFSDETFPEPSAQNIKAQEAVNPLYDALLNIKALARYAGAPVLEIDVEKLIPHGKLIVKGSPEDLRSGENLHAILAKEYPRETAALDEKIARREVSKDFYYDTLEQLRMSKDEIQCTAGHSFCLINKGMIEKADRTEAYIINMLVTFYKANPAFEIVPLNDGGKIPFKPQAILAAFKTVRALAGVNQSGVDSYIQRLFNGRRAEARHAVLASYLSFLGIKAGKAQEHLYKSFERPILQLVARMDEATDERDASSIVNYDAVVEAITAKARGKRGVLAYYARYWLMYAAEVDEGRFRDKIKGIDLSVSPSRFIDKRDAKRISAKVAPGIK